MLTCKCKNPFAKVFITNLEKRYNGDAKEQNKTDGPGAKAKASMKIGKYNTMFSFIHVSLEKISKALNFVPADLKCA